MKLTIKVAYLKGMKLSGPMTNALMYKSADQFIDFDASAFSQADLDKLYALAKKDDGAKGARGLMQKVSAYRNVRADPEGQKIGRLEPLVTAIRSYVERGPNKWLFREEKDGFHLPYYVSHVEYDRGGKHSPPRVTMSLAAVTRDRHDGTSASFDATDLGKTVVEILNDSGFYLETEAAVASYMVDVERYKELSPLTGTQFYASGSAFASSGWSHGARAMERDGDPGRVVMDDASRDEDSRSEKSSPLVSTSFWNAKKTGDAGVEEEDDDGGTKEGATPRPVHPYVKVFDLRRHEFVLIHVGNLTPYVYDTSLIDKLVLADDVKDLLAILVEASAEVMEDIVLGKTGGTIVLATGHSGTGKTLSAEVVSEQMRRPLYVVQCSQLGTDEVRVEKQLQLVLDRASRWGAILLIDEADVYVRERGKDIRQNAIVGVFLRVLEHYRGVLFLTSNRETVIDDAILSRATAWIRYELPTRHELACIWNVLSKQYGAVLGAATIASLVERFPSLSGRNIKSLLKLATMLTKRRGKAMDIALFEHVSRFIALSSEQRARVDKLDSKTAKG